MARLNAHEAFKRAAQNYEAMVPADQGDFDEAVEALTSDATWIESHRAEADDWNDGMQDGEHYSAVEIALADLYDYRNDTASLAGSEMLARLMRLAAVHGEAREAKLREMAEQQVSDDFDRAEEARDEARRSTS
ncbi:hypothetical protein ACYX7E_10125 [Luteimonas sp. RIT-PG2_3]